jgi:hypothetical protein
MNSPDPVPASQPRPNRPWLFQPGQSGNPGGNAKGTRRRLTARFLEDLAKDFEDHGKEVIERCRTKDPAAYLNAIVRLCPRELEVSTPLDELDNDALRLIMAAAQRYVQRQKAQAIELVPAAASEGPTP